MGETDISASNNEEMKELKKKLLEYEKQNCHLNDEITSLKERLTDEEIKYYTVKKERDVFKYDIEKVSGVLKANNIEIELESTSLGNEEGGSMTGLKLIDEYT